MTIEKAFFRTLDVLAIRQTTDLIPSFSDCRNLEHRQAIRKFVWTLYHHSATYPKRKK